MPQTIPIACSLDKADLPDRASLMEALGRDLVAVQADGMQATLRFQTDQTRLEEFVRADSSCCPVFEFEIGPDTEVTTLRIGAPAGAEWALRGLVAGVVAGWSGLA